MTALATASDLEALTGRDLSGSEERVEALLRMASDQFRLHAEGQQIHSETETVTLDGNGASVLQLPQVPVTAVTSVEVDGEALDSDDYEWSADGMLGRTSGVWPNEYRVIEVNYTHGYSEIPYDVRAAVCSIAARALDNPGQLAQESIGQYSRSFGTAGVGIAGLTASEKATAERYRQW